MAGVFPHLLHQGASKADLAYGLNVMNQENVAKWAKFEDGSADVHNELRYMFVSTQTHEGYEREFGTP